MKTRLHYILIASLMLLLVTTSCSKKSSSNYSCTIAGTVIELDSGDPVQSATVTLSPSGKNTYTGYDGSFEFLDLNDTQYTITVQKTGYKSNRKTVTTEAGGTINVSITLEKKE